MQYLRLNLIVNVDEIEWHLLGVKRTVLRSKMFGEIDRQRCGSDFVCLVEQLKIMMTRLDEKEQKTSYENS